MKPSLRLFIEFTWSGFGPATGIIKSFFLFLILIFFINCNHPNQLDGQRNADCTTPTIIQNTALNNDEVKCVVEIYDFEQKLVNYGETVFDSAAVPIIIDDVAIYWQGTDFEGNPVGPGKYIVKVSWYTKKKEGCACKDIYLK